MRPRTCCCRKVFPIYNTLPTRDPLYTDVSLASVCSSLFVDCRANLSFPAGSRVCNVYLRCRHLVGLVCWPRISLWAIDDVSMINSPMNSYAHLAIICCQTQGIHYRLVAKARPAGSVPPTHHHAFPRSAWKRVGSSTLFHALMSIYRLLRMSFPIPPSSSPFPPEFVGIMAVLVTTQPPISWTILYVKLPVILFPIQMMLF